VTQAPPPDKSTPEKPVPPSTPDVAGTGTSDGVGVGVAIGDDPESRAASRIGRTIHAHLEVLHMTDPDAAIATIKAIVPVLADLLEIGEDLETLGARDLARDVRLAVDRRRREVSR